MQFTQRIYITHTQRYVHVYMHIYIYTYIYTFSIFHIFYPHIFSSVGRPLLSKALPPQRRRRSAQAPAARRGAGRGRWRPAADGAGGAALAGAGRVGWTLWNCMVINKDFMGFDGD